MSSHRPHANAVLTPESVQQLQEATEDVFVHNAVAEYVVRLVHATRVPQQYGITDLGGVLEFGVSPRATLGLVAAGRALALLRGRDYVLPADVYDVAHDVMAHRLVLTFDALADGVDPRAVISRILQVIEQPHVVPADDTPGTALSGSAA
jgi:MoxR-like ATPase